MGYKEIYGYNGDFSSGLFHGKCSGFLVVMRDPRWVKLQCTATPCRSEEFQSRLRQGWKGVDGSMVLPFWHLQRYARMVNLWLHGCLKFIVHVFPTALDVSAIHHKLQYSEPKGLMSYILYENILYTHVFGNSYDIPYKNKGNNCNHI